MGMSEEKMQERIKLERDKKLLQEQVEKMKSEIAEMKRNDSKYAEYDQDIEEYLNIKQKELKNFDNEQDKLLKDIPDDEIINKTREENNRQRNYIQKKIEEIERFMKLTKLLESSQKNITDIDSRLSSLPSASLDHSESPRITPSSALSMEAKGANILSVFQKPEKQSQLFKEFKLKPDSSTDTSINFKSNEPVRDITVLKDRIQTNNVDMENLKVMSTVLYDATKDQNVKNYTVNGETEKITSDAEYALAEVLLAKKADDITINGKKPIDIKIAHKDALDTNNNQSDIPTTPLRIR